VNTLGGVRYINTERERKECFKKKKKREIVKGFKNVQTF
jgi:hypothetical protein